MINIDKFKKFVYLIANKNGRGTLPPSDFDSATERALFAWTQNQLSNQKQYQPGNPISQTSLELDQESIDKLRHLKEMRSIAVVNGEMPIPNGVILDLNGQVMPDYWRYSKIMHKYSKSGKAVRRQIEIIKDFEFGNRIDSDIVPPTKKRAIGLFQNTYIEIEPKNLITLVTLTYIRNPKTPKWAYDIVNNRPVYNEGNSVDIDAPESAFNPIAMITLSLIGIHIREEELVQASIMMENKGI